MKDMSSRTDVEGEEKRKISIVDFCRVRHADGSIRYYNGSTR